MNIQEYNDHLRQFHADSFRDLAFKKSISDAKKHTKNYFISYATVFNQEIANTLLDTLKNNAFKQHFSRQLQDVFDFFPEMYWKTNESYLFLEIISNNIKTEALNNDSAELFLKEIDIEIFQMLIDFSIKNTLLLTERYTSLTTEKSSHTLSVNFFTSYIQELFLLINKTNDQEIFNHNTKNLNTVISYLIDTYSTSNLKIIGNNLIYTTLKNFESIAIDNHTIPSKKHLRTHL